MTNHLNSGLYEQFYKKHKIDFSTEENAYEDVEYNRKLLAEYYDIELDEDNEAEKQLEELEETFWDALSLWPTYFEPMVFNEAIAIECGLIPFTYKGVSMLAFGACGMDLSPLLDAYQALTHKTIDKDSRLFSHINKQDNYFEHVVGKDIMEKVLKAIA